MDEVKFVAKRLVGKKESQLTPAEKDEIRREQLRLNPEKFERVGLETHDEEADLRLQNAGEKYHKVLGLDFVVCDSLSHFVHKEMSSNSFCGHQAFDRRSSNRVDVQKVNVARS